MRKSKAKCIYFNCTITNNIVKVGVPVFVIPLMLLIASGSYLLGGRKTTND